MKTGLQKHTSKFVAGLFNSLGIIACVSLTSCGDKNKGKHTENQGENLKNKLKSVAFYQNLAEDEDRLNAIAEWLNDKNYGSDYILTEEDLQEIFKNDPSGLREVAGKLGVRLTESDPNRDDENQKSGITLKIEGEGKVIITKVADNTTTDFVFGEIKNLQGFVENLKNKEITKVEGELSFVFEGNNVKICGHNTGFNCIANLVDFFNYFEVLTKIKGLNLTVSGLSLKTSDAKLYLNEVECSDDYFKSVKFWTLVKDNPTLFGVNDLIFVEKQGDDENAIVIIDGTFKSSLKWSDVVAKGDEAFVVNSGWDKIFKLKGKEESVGEVTVEFKATGKYSINNGDDVGLGDFNSLQKFVDGVRGKTVKETNSKKIEFSVKDGKTITVKVDELVGFDVTITKENFSVLLEFVGNLESVGLVRKGFKFKVEAGENVIKFGDTGVGNEFLVSKEAWEIIKGKKDLFNLGEKGVKVEKSGEGNKYVKIGTLGLKFDVLDGNGNAEGSKISDAWENVFTLGK